MPTVTQSKKNLSKQPFQFKKKTIPESVTPNEAPWKLLVIDDDRDVHKLTHHVLKDFFFEGRTLEIISGSSGTQAKTLIQEHPDTAVLFLDVVMEEEHAGLDVVDFIRNHLHNKQVRILLRTGQAGLFPEEQIFEQFHINDFLEKSELTSRRLKTALKVALRNYQDLLDFSEFTQIKAEKESIALEFEATIWQMASGVGHEIGNVLMCLMGLNYRLSRLIQNSETGVSSEVLPKAKNLMEKFETQLEHGQKIVATLSGLKRRAQEKTHFLVPNMLEELVEALKWRKKTEAEFELSCDTAELSAFANPDEIRQILINLIYNAVDATQGLPKEESVIQIHTSQTQGKADNKILISVQDSGSGIPEASLSQIFDHFFTTKTRGKATGLGLAICKTLAENNGGSLSLHRTEEGKGSTFLLSLPCEGSHNAP